MFLRLQDNVPYVYPNESRDFQLLCRLFDGVNNSVISDIDSMTNIIESKNCNSVALGLLATKLGFFPKHELNSDELRTVLDAFPYIVRYKGSRRAIEESVSVFLKVNHINSGAYVEIVNKNQEDPEESYVVRIGLESRFRDVRVLDELFRYILPTGYRVEYFFYSRDIEIDRYFNRSKATLIIVSDNIQSSLYNSRYTHSDGTDWKEKNENLNMVSMVELIRQPDEENPSGANPDSYTLDISEVES